MAYFTDSANQRFAPGCRDVKKQFGKSPDIVAAKYSVGTYSVPSGKMETLRDQRRQPVIIQKGEGTLNIIGDPRSVVIQAGPSLRAG